VYDINVLDDENDNNIVEYYHSRKIARCDMQRRTIARSDAAVTICISMNKFVNK